MAFTWIIRVLVVLFLIRLVLRAIAGAARGPQRRRAAPRPLERAGGALVRDPQCGTYIPQAGAISLRSGATTHYFCSAACRDAFAAAPRARDARAG